jgi:hypothetical protein
MQRSENLTHRLERCRDEGRFLVLGVGAVDDVNVKRQADVGE